MTDTNPSTGTSTPLSELRAAAAAATSPPPAAPAPAAPPAPPALSADVQQAAPELVQAVSESIPVAHPIPPPAPPPIIPDSPAPMVSDASSPTDKPKEASAGMLSFLSSASFKLGVAMMLLFVVVGALPVDAIVNKFAFLKKIPCGSTLIKALTTGVSAAAIANNVCKFS